MRRQISRILDLVGSDCPRKLKSPWMSGGGRYLSPHALTGRRGLHHLPERRSNSPLLPQQVDVDCVVIRGQLLFACVSDNHPCKQPSAGSGRLMAFVEAGGRCPSSLPDSAQAQLLALTARVVAMFGDALYGVMHFEAMYNPSTQVWTEVSSLPVDVILHAMPRPHHV